MTQLTGRERITFILAAALVGLFVLDRLVVSGLWRWRQDRLEQRQLIEQQLAAAAALIDQVPIFQRQWAKMNQEPLAVTNSDAEGRAYHAVRRWAHDSGLKLESIQPQRVINATGLPAVVFRTTGTGAMPAVAGFLQRLATAPLAIRIERLQIASRRDGEDDLTLELELSTLFDPSLSPAATQEPAS